MAEQKGYSIIPLIALLAGFYTRIYIVKSLGPTSDNAIGEAIGNKSPFFINKNSGGDDRALTIELLDRLLFPDNYPVFAEN